MFMTDCANDGVGCIPIWTAQHQVYSLSIALPFQALRAHKFSDPSFSYTSQHQSAIFYFLHVLA